MPKYFLLNWVPDSKLKWERLVCFRAKLDGPPIPLRFHVGHHCRLIPVIGHKDNFNAIIFDTLQKCCFVLHMLFLKLEQSDQYRATYHVVPEVLLTSRQTFRFSIRSIYRVTIQAVPNLLLTTKWMLRFSICSLYWNTTFVMMSTGGSEQPEWSPCTFCVDVC